MSGLRSLARRFLGVQRIPTYYLPWLTRPGLECVLVLSNVEARFMEGQRHGPFPLSLVQYDTEGRVVRRYQVTLIDATDIAELPLEPRATGYGFVTVDVRRIHSDLYVTLSDGTAYTATHGRQEFIELYPAWTRALLAILSGALAPVGLTIPAFTRHQFVYIGRESRSHVLLLNLSNVRNLVRIVASRGGALLGSRLVALSPMGSHLLDASTLARENGEPSQVLRLLLQGNAWFNLYLVGAGPGDLAGPLSLMHVK